MRRRPATAELHESGIHRSRAKAEAPFVLVADDVEDNREIYAAYLSYHGYRVEEAIDGADALRKVEERMPDLVLMDLAMPNVDGWEATRRIKSDERTRHILVIALTGHAFGANLGRADETGADAVLTKPCTPDSLLDIVERLLDR